MSVTARNCIEKHFGGMRGLHGAAGDKSFDPRIYLAEISLALLIFVLVIAANSIGKAQQEARETAGKMEDLLNTPQGQAWKEREEALLALQYQKLLQALDAIEKEERERLALNAVTLRLDDPDSFGVDDLIVEGGVAQNGLGELFCSGCRYARKCFSSDAAREALSADWIKRVLENAKMRLPGRLDVPIVSQDISLITRENAELFSAELARRLKAIEKDTRDLQNAARLNMYSYFRANSSAIRDDTLISLRDRFARAINDPNDAGQSELLVTEFEKSLHEYVSQVFERGGAPLLPPSL